MEDITNQDFTFAEKPADDYQEVLNRLNKYIDSNKTEICIPVVVPTNEKIKFKISDGTEVEADGAKLFLSDNEVQNCTVEELAAWCNLLVPLLKIEDSVKEILKLGDNKDFIVGDILVLQSMLKFPKTGFVK